MQTTNQVMPVPVIATRDCKECKEYNVCERSCLCLACCPCVGWSVLFRFLCLPCDCMFGHPCGGNGCTNMCDESCFFPVMFGKVI